MKHRLMALLVAVALAAALPSVATATTTRIPFSGTGYVIDEISPGTTTMHGTVLSVRGMTWAYMNDVPTPLLAGPDVVVINYDLDVVTGLGELWGTDQPRPTAYPGGGFNCTWHGTWAGGMPPTWTGKDVCHGFDELAGYQLRYDGVTVDRTLRSPFLAVTRLAVGPDGTLWASDAAEWRTDQARWGLARLRGDEWEAVRPPGGEASEPARIASVTESGELWVLVMPLGGDEVRLLRFDGRTWSEPVPSTLLEPDRVGVAAGPGGRVWVASPAGLAEVDGDAVTMRAGGVGFGRVLSAAPDGTVLGTDPYGSGVMRWRGGG